jgi:hypothetical protein
VIIILSLDAHKSILETENPSLLGKYKKKTKKPKKTQTTGLFFFPTLACHGWTVPSRKTLCTIRNEPIDMRRLLCLYKVSQHASNQCGGSGMFIPDPDFYPSRIPDLGSKNSNKREG